MLAGDQQGENVSESDGLTPGTQQSLNGVLKPSEKPRGSTRSGNTFRRAALASAMAVRPDLKGAKDRRFGIRRSQGTSRSLLDLAVPTDLSSDGPGAHRSQGSLIAPVDPVNQKGRSSAGSGSGAHRSQGSLAAPADPVNQTAVQQGPQANSRAQDREV
jgi:hypothetical protein